MAAIRSFLSSLLRNPGQIILMIGVVILAFIALSNVVPLAGRPVYYRADSFLRDLLLGLTQGSIYALLAVGYTLIYGMLKLINFAHGDVFMLGAYLGFFALAGAGRSGINESSPILALGLTLVVGMLASVLVSLFIDKYVYRPLRTASRLAPLVAAIGVSIVIQQLTLRLFGSAIRRYPEINWYVLPQLFPNQGCIGEGASLVCRGLDIIGGSDDLSLLGLTVRVQWVQFVVIAASALLLAGFYWYIRQTKIGKAMRAVSTDRVTAVLMGIHVDRMVSSAFLLSALLAGAGGVLFALYTQQVSPFIGFLPGIKAFTAAVLGGMGHVPGAIAAALMLGVLETVGPPMLGLSPQLNDLVAFVLLILVLSFRPQGFMGGSAPRKRA